MERPVDNTNQKIYLMNPIFTQVITQIVRRTVQGKYASGNLRKYNLGKEIYKLKISSIHLIKDSLLILVGIISAGFGLEGFLLLECISDDILDTLDLLWLTNSRKFPHKFCRKDKEPCLANHYNRFSNL